MQISPIINSIASYYSISILTLSRPSFWTIFIHSVKHAFYKLFFFNNTCRWKIIMYLTELWNKKKRLMKERKTWFNKSILYNFMPTSIFPNFYFPPISFGRFYLKPLKTFSISGCSVFSVDRFNSDSENEAFLKKYYPPIKKFPRSTKRALCVHRCSCSVKIHPIMSWLVTIIFVARCSNQSLHVMDVITS